MSIERLLITVLGRTLILRASEGVGGLEDSCWLDGGDQPDLEALGFRPCLKRLASLKPLDKQGITYDPRTKSWFWTFTHWSRQVVSTAELEGAQVWWNPTWHGASIDRVWWQDFTQGGTVVRASFSGAMDTELHREMSDHYRAGRYEEYARVRPLAEAEFVAFARRYDPDNPVYRDSQTTLLLPVAEISKTLTPVPAEILSLIERSIQTGRGGGG